MIDDKTLGAAMKEVQDELDGMMDAKKKDVKEKTDKEKADAAKKLDEVRTKLLRMQAQIDASGTNSVFKGQFENAQAKLNAMIDPSPSPGGPPDPTNPSYVVSPPQVTPDPQAAQAKADEVKEPAPMNTLTPAAKPSTPAHTAPKK